MHEGDQGWAAVPGLASDSTAKRGRLLYNLEVGGELFAVRDHDAGTDYDWLSGPNAGYGFSTSGGASSQEGHRANIRAFLDMIDPATGYIAEH